MADLTDEHRAILDFEGSWWKYAGAKEAEVRDRFGMTATRYYQVLNWIIDQPAALAYAPATVKRLQRIRAARAGQRPARRHGFMLA